jgi:IS605 OrfB family transposase
MNFLLLLLFCGLCLSIYCFINDFFFSQFLSPPNDSSSYPNLSSIESFVSNPYGNVGRELEAEAARLMLAKAWRKVKLQREDYLYKVTSMLASRYGHIFIEKFGARGMTRRKRDHKNINRSILDCSFHMIKRLAAYKAEVVEVDPTNTSRMCSRCGNIGTKKESYVRVFSCKCGLELDRDHNAALNILTRGQGLPFVENKPLLVNASKSLYETGSGLR